MSFESSLMTISWIVLISLSATRSKINPEQIHLSLTECPEEMLITWITFLPTRNSLAWYGFLKKGLTFKAEGKATKFVDDGSSKVVRYVHRVVLKGLEPDTFYIYRCGSHQKLSAIYSFKTIPKGTDWSPRVIIYGDMGWKGAGILPFIKKEIAVNTVDAIFHIGDIAYNMDSCDGEVGDEFLRMIEPIASSVPYMTAVGNHEQAYNFSHYKNKFTMPGNSKGMFYSFDFGPIHVVTVSTEVYYFTEYGIEPLITQYNWLKSDLEKASRAENRHLRPWIFIFGHRPMYCSSDTQEDCSFEKNILKCCCYNCRAYNLEYLYHENKVDLVFAGHMHYYERSWPLYANTVFNGSCREPYTNPGAAVHIITGAAGMVSGTETASYIRRDWFAFYSNDYSYTVLTVCNATHVLLEQVSASRGGEIIDSFWLIKNRI